MTLRSATEPPVATQHARSGAAMLQRYAGQQQ